MVSLAFLSRFLSRYGVQNCCHTQGGIRFYVPYNMCIETRARRLLCDTKIKYSPPHICSGEDDKPSLNPSGEKHREQTICTVLESAMKSYQKLHEALSGSNSLIKTNVSGTGFAFTCFSKDCLSYRSVATAMRVWLESESINVHVGVASSCTFADVESFVASQPDKHVLTFPGYLFVVEAMPLLTGFDQFMDGVVFSWNRRAARLAGASR
ncbi:hypothetical protein SynA1544_50008 [Synechococcus sp. A15-44]|nr:hypothetical protein SynA1544_50008 [Synechococcus sp. A15-44]